MPASFAVRPWLDSLALLQEYGRWPILNLQLTWSRRPGEAGRRALLFPGGAHVSHGADVGV